MILDSILCILVIIVLYIPLMGLGLFGCMCVLKSNSNLNDFFSIENFFIILINLILLSFSLFERIEISETIKFK